MSEQPRDIVARHPKMPACKAALLAISVLLCAVGVLGAVAIPLLVSEFLSSGIDISGYGTLEFPDLSPYSTYVAGAVKMLFALVPGVAGLLLFRKNTHATREAAKVSAGLWALSCFPFITGALIVLIRVVSYSGAAEAGTLALCSFVTLTVLVYILCVALYVRDTAGETGAEASGDLSQGAPPGIGNQGGLP